MELALPLPIRGLILGFTIAAAVGPITLLVIRRTIEHGHLYGFVSGVGVAAADATYAGIAAFGLTAITSLLLSVHTVLAVVGGAVIVIVGIRTMVTRAATVARDAPRPGLPGALASIYGLTMTNPLTVVLYVGVFAGIGLAAGSSFLDAAVLTIAVLVGSTLWWVVLTSLVAFASDRVSPRVLTWVNRVSGAALVVFGIAAVWAVIA